MYMWYFKIKRIFIHLKDWCWSCNSNTLATWLEELTHLQRPWCWERLRVWGEGDDRGRDGQMASPTQWTWVWVNSRGCWWTGRPCVLLQFMGLQRVRHACVTELNWIFILNLFKYVSFLLVLNILCLSLQIHFPPFSSLSSAPGTWLWETIMLFCLLTSVRISWWETAPRDWQGCQEWSGFLSQLLLC